MPEVVGRLRTPRLAAAPSSPAVGEVYYDTALSILYWWNGTSWISAAGTTQLDYNGAYPTGTPYTDGDIVVYNGISYLCVRPTSAAPKPWFGGPTPAVYGTSLPASPYDGQEAVLVDSLTNPSYQWRFRYNAGSSSAYKWEYVGGSPASNYVAAVEYRAAGGAGDLATVGPRIQAPRAGEYEILIIATIQKGTAAAVAFDAWFRAWLETQATATGTTGYFRGMGSTTNVITARVVAETMGIAVGAGEFIKPVYTSSIFTTDLVYMERRINLTPRRVS